MSANSGMSISTGFWLAILSGVAMLMSGLGSKWGLWNFMIGFIILLLSALLGLIAAIICCFDLNNAIKSGFNGSGLLIIAGIIIGLFISGSLVFTIINARNIPLINDITTDTNNPPKFVAIMPLRKNAPVGSVYPGPDAAAKQLKAFPKIKTIVTEISADEAFDRAMATGIKMGWKIADSNKAEGRIEATATTFWFGFTDDIVIRITTVKTGSMVDMRSVSRVGKGDLGTNAKRILKFMKLMAEPH